MAKQMKSKALQPKHSPSEQENDDEESVVMDEAKLMDRKEKMFAEKPELKHVFDNLEAMNRKRAEQAQNSSVVFENRRGEVTEELLEQFPNSPTAKQAMAALNHYKIAACVLFSYNKPRVLISSDCDYIQPGLHHYIEGYMLAQYMNKQFPLPRAFENWIEDYLKLRPNDILVEYLYINIIVPFKAQKKSDYERCKDIIRAREKFIHKLLPYKAAETEKRILTHSYFMLGAIYTSTDQYGRALEAFEKCFALDAKNLEALHGIAFHHKDKDPKKAMSLCHKYLDMAPKCDEKYPDTQYLIGYLYLVHLKNIELAKKYYRLGLVAEKDQLPFNPPTNCEPKIFLKGFIHMPDRKEPETHQELEFLD